MAKRGENIYKRKDSRYEGRYIKGHSLNNKPIFGYVYAYTYTEVKNALTLAKAAAKQDKSICLIGKGSLAEFLCYWLTQVIKERVKTSTYAQYYERIYRHIIPALGHIAVHKLTGEQVQGFVEDLNKKGFAASTVTGITGVLISAMADAHGFHLTAANPCDGLSLPKPDTQERRALDREEQTRLERLAASAEPDLELAVFLALYAGLRIGELCALKWRDINLFSGTLTVRATLQRVKNIDGGASKTLIIEGEPKSRRSHRLLPLPSGLTDKLLRHDKNMSGDSYVLSGTDKPIEPRRLRARFSKLAAKAGLAIPFHSLRHTFSTRCLEHNFDIQTLSELLGHATASTTMKVYAHSVFEHKRLLTSRITILSENSEPSNEPSATGAVY